MYETDVANVLWFTLTLLPATTTGTVNTVGCCGCTAVLADGPTEGQGSNWRRGRDVNVSHAVDVL